MNRFKTIESTFLTNNPKLITMKTYNPNEIKNIALVGSAGSGKTTLAEAMMYEGGVIPRRGSVSAKNTSSDYRPVEQEYGSSVFPAVLYTEWKDQKLNFIDTPGADDFVGGVISALNVADTAVMVVNAVKGVEVGTEIISRHVRNLNKPMIFVINQLDHEKANFEQTLEHAQLLSERKWYWYNIRSIRGSVSIRWWMS